MFKGFWNSLYKLARLPAAFWPRDPCLEDGSQKILPMGCLVTLNPLISSVAVLPPTISVDMWGHNPPHFLRMERNDTLKCKYEHGVPLILLLNISHFADKLNRKVIISPVLLLICAAAPFPSKNEAVLVCRTCLLESSVYSYDAALNSLRIILLKPIGLLELYARICTTKG